MNPFLDELIQKHPLTPTLRERNAYALIFEIENYIRVSLIGHEIKFCDDKTPLHILIKLLDKIPSHSQITLNDKLNLNRIIDVRNKIAHMKLISEREYDLLVECWADLFVKNNTTLKVNLLHNLDLS